MITPEILGKIKLLIDAVKLEKSGKRLSDAHLSVIESVQSQQIGRWTINGAATDFGINRATLTSRIKACGILAGADGKFSTRDICRAVFTDGEAARAALAVSQTELVDLKKKKLAGELVSAAQCQQLWDAAIIALRQKISDAPLPDAVKLDLVKDLQSIPIEEYQNKGHIDEPEEQN